MDVDVVGEGWLIMSKGNVRVTVDVMVNPYLAIYIYIYYTKK